jgi:outer membrane protein assembly factor BamE (lipoprotein component of BamABCDE complex)
MTRFLNALAVCLALLLQACAANPVPAGPLLQRNDEMFARVQQGMTRVEVLAITGRPDNSVPYPNSGTDSWGYYYFDTWGYYCEFGVTFGSDGRVVSKISRRLNDGKGRDG